MWRIANITLIIELLTAIGCASNRDVEHAESGVLVPLPQSTPYDYYTPSRDTYLKYYADGYRDGVLGRAVFSYYPAGEYPAMAHQGYVDGNSAGCQVWLGHVTTPKTGD